MIFIYNILFPFVFICFIPGIIIKLINRGGHKKNYLERLSIFSKEKLKEFAEIRDERVVWIHSVSVGETQLAADFVKYWKFVNPALKFVISTTTTTGQALAVKKLADDAVIIFNPIDFSWAVRKLLKLIKPEMLVIFETELWPNMIHVSSKAGVKVCQVNARISDHSFKGYKRFRMFIAPFMRGINLTCAQTDTDIRRLKEIAPFLNLVKTGTMKFDQKVPEVIPEIKLKELFPEDSKILLGASTHPGEEKFIAEIFKSLKTEYSNLKLILVPRHAERGGDIVKILDEMSISYHRRSLNGKVDKMVDCLLADTTGEMLSFMNRADIVIMGKSFAGNDEGHNIIEPAILGKPVICGKVLRNFRFVLKIMQDSNAVLSIDDSELERVLSELLSEPEKCLALGKRALKTVDEQKGATEKTVAYLEELLAE